MSKKEKKVILCVTYDELITMAEINEVEPYKSGNGIQCHFCMPNGHIWLIIWCKSVPPMNVTIHDGKVGAIIHDQI